VSTATGTTPAGTGAVIGYAQGVLLRARQCPWPADDGANHVDFARREIGDAISWLREALTDYADLAEGVRRPQDVFPDLGPGALAEALARVAEDAGKDAGELVRVIAEHIGEQAAEEVRGEDKGEKS
jgi:hypothetical protein